MNKISNETKKLILDFEENGFSSKFKDSSISFSGVSIALKKDIQKRNFKISVFYFLAEVSDSSFVMQKCSMSLDLLINDILEIESVVSFIEITKCPIILQTISEFVIDSFIFMESNELKISSTDTEYITITPKDSKNEITLYLYFVNGSLKYFLQNTRKSASVSYSLDEISKKDTPVLFEELKNKILQHYTI